MLTEVGISSILLRELGLNKFIEDKRASILHLSLQFGEKLRFAWETGALTDDEYHRIDKFNSFRNALLHSKKGKVAWFFAINEKEKKEVMESAWESVRATYSAFGRLVKGGSQKKG